MKEERILKKADEDVLKITIPESKQILAKVSINHDGCPSQLMEKYRGIRVDCSPSGRGYFCWLIGPNRQRRAFLDELVDHRRAETVRLIDNGPMGDFFEVVEEPSIYETCLANVFPKIGIPILFKREQYIEGEGVEHLFVVTSSLEEVVRLIETYPDQTREISLMSCSEIKAVTNWEALEKFGFLGFPYIRNMDIERKGKELSQNDLLTTEEILKKAGISSAQFRVLRMKGLVESYVKKVPIVGEYKRGFQYLYAPDTLNQIDYVKKKRKEGKSLSELQRMEWMKRVN